METTSLKLYAWDYRNVKTYFAVLAFVLGNILLPQIFHLLPNGGKIFLPIYFFTLIGAYKYGWKVGLLTAICSPLINSLLFGMPSAAILPVMISKSILLAIGAGMAAKYLKNISIPILTTLVLSYQVVGSFGEWLFYGSFYPVIQDFKMSIPGLFLQVMGGYLFIKYLLNKLD